NASLSAVSAAGCTGPAGTDMVWAGTPAADVRKTRTDRIRFRRGMIDYRLTGSRKPGTDTKFPAQFAGNWLSGPGFAPGRLEVRNPAPANGRAATSAFDPAFDPQTRFPHHGNRRTGK